MKLNVSSVCTCGVQFPFVCAICHRGILLRLETHLPSLRQQRAPYHSKSNESQIIILKKIFKEKMIENISIRNNDNCLLLLAGDFLTKIFLLNCIHNLSKF